MSAETRPKPTSVTVCDICGNEIDTGRYSDFGARGSLLGGTGLPPASARTPWMQMRWPSFEWLRTAKWQDKAKPENRERYYDFHGGCLVALVDSAITARRTPDLGTTEPKAKD